MAKFQSKLNIIQPILDQLKAEADLLTAEFITVETYCNGREQGYVMIALPETFKSVWQTVAFAQCRNSDSIVVYCGVNGDFRLAGNIPAEHVWSNAMYFNENNHQTIVEFIRDHLNK